MFLRSALRGVSIDSVTGTDIQALSALVSEVKASAAAGRKCNFRSRLGDPDASAIDDLARRLREGTFGYTWSTFIEDLEWYCQSLPRLKGQSANVADLVGRVNAALGRGWLRQAKSDIEKLKVDVGDADESWK